MQAGAGVQAARDVPHSPPDGLASDPELRKLSPQRGQAAFTPAGRAFHSLSPYISPRATDNAATALMLRASPAGMFHRS